METVMSLSMSKTIIYPVKIAEQTIKAQLNGTIYLKKFFEIGL